MPESPHELIAVAASVENGMVFLHLLDGSTHAFPIHYYPRLRGANADALKRVLLRVGGRALRWEDLDEDIWVADAVCQRYPRAAATQVAEPPSNYKT